MNHLDIAPTHASVLMGISNTFATIPGIISPMLTGFIVQTKSEDEWRLVFYIAAGIYLVGCVIYWFWASGEVQPWAKEDFTFNLEAGSKRTSKLSGYTNEAVELKE